MKNASACLKCGNEIIWRVDPVSFFDREYANFIPALPVACRMVENPDAGLLARPTVRKAVGHFVAYVCASCGYTEMYATDIGELAKLQQGEDGSRVTRSTRTD
jgi:predicted nucleic-acid-binding Zn-ribbon protein